MNDACHLQRFVEAQDRVYADVVAELTAGMKRSHWMWYVFPQIAGLGHSPVSRRYAIASIEEARAYCEHPTLGARLVECVELVLAIEERSIEHIFGYPDYLKFRSSMTLFAIACEKRSQFQRALDKYFNGSSDPRTLQALDNTA